MSTVKIKTEPTATTAATTATVDAKVKLEPSLSTADIKFEQYTSDIDTKVESESDADSDIKSEYDDDDEDTDQIQFTIIPKKQRKFICKHSGCGRSYKKSSHLKRHQPEHKLQTDINVLGKAYHLVRRSLNDRWSCPFPDCTSTLKTVRSLCNHIRASHDNTMGLQQLQQPPVKKTRPKLYFTDLCDFYMNGVRCGYHNTIGVFICYECRLVPECLLTHLQQKHGYDEKSIDNTALPDSAVNAGAEPNTNQHTSNSHLASAVRHPYQQHHKNIVQGWLCVTSGCGYCGYIVDRKNDHKIKVHHGEQITTVPALILRLHYAKTWSLCYLITRIDQASGAVTVSNNRVNQHKLDNYHNGYNTQDGNEDDTSQNEFTEASNQRQQWKCGYPDCGRIFSSADQLSAHRRDHKLEAVIRVRGNTFTLSRQSLDDRWLCPVPDCETKYKAIDTIRKHILKVHSTLVREKRTNSEDDNDQQRKYLKRAQPIAQYLKVDDFYVSGTRCGYHKPTGVFLCHICRLVPEYLPTHLQQTHGFDEKSIDNAILPDSARIAGSDPNGNQHTSNPHLASAIRNPYQCHPDIIQGWLCVTSGCGYCGYTVSSKNDHKRKVHQGEQVAAVPALVLCLHYAKTRCSYFLITRLDIATSINSGDSSSQYKNECDVEEDDGDELVLSDYSDDDDVH